MNLFVGDIVRIKKSAYRPWTLEQTQTGDMVIVKKELLHFSDTPEPPEPLFRSRGWITTVSPER